MPKPDTFDRAMDSASRARGWEASHTLWDCKFCEAKNLEESARCPKCDRTLWRVLSKGKSLSLKTWLRMTYLAYVCDLDWHHWAFGWRGPAARRDCDCGGWATGEHIQGCEVIGEFRSYRVMKPSNLEEAAENYREICRVYRQEPKDLPSLVWEYTDRDGNFCRIDLSNEKEARISIEEASFVETPDTVTLSACPKHLYRRFNTFLEYLATADAEATKSVK